MTFNEAMKSLELKFISGNDIQVERATIVKDEFEAIINEIKRLEEIELTTYKDIQTWKEL